VFLIVILNTPLESGVIGCFGEASSIVITTGEGFAGGAARRGLKRKPMKTGIIALERKKRFIVCLTLDQCVVGNA